MIPLVPVVSPYYTQLQASVYEGYQMGVAGEVPRQVLGRCRDTSLNGYGMSR